MAVLGEGERQRAAGWRSAASESPGALEQALLLFPLFFSQVMLILIHLQLQTGLRYCIRMRKTVRATDFCWK